MQTIRIFNRSQFKFSFSWHSSPLVGQGTLINEVSKLHKIKRTIIGLPWTSHQPDEQISTLQHTILREIYASTGFEPTISARGRPLTHALDRAATGTGAVQIIIVNLAFYPKEFSKN